MPTIDFRPKPRFLGKGKAFIFWSESDPGKFHITVKLDDGMVVCSCTGFQFSDKCWHIDKVNGDDS